MELTIIFNTIAGLVTSGNYVGALFIIVVVIAFVLYKKLSNIEKSQQPKHEKTDYNKFIESDSVVMDELEAIRRRYNADRAIVLELRNGEVNVADIPSMKVYVRNERLKPRVFSVSSIINGVPASFYSRALRQMVKNKPYLLPDVNDLEDIDFGLFQNLISSNVKSLYSIPLFDKNKVIYGCLMLEYCSEFKCIDDSGIHSLEVDAARLNGEILVMKKVERHQV